MIFFGGYARFPIDDSRVLGQANRGSETKNHQNLLNLNKGTRRNSKVRDFFDGKTLTSPYENRFSLLVFLILFHRVLPDIFSIISSIKFLGHLYYYLWHASYGYSMQTISLEARIKKVPLWENRTLRRRKFFELMSARLAN